MKAIKLLLFSCFLSYTTSIMAYDLEIDGICYNLNVSSKTLTVAKNSNYEGYINIPDEVEYNTQKLKVVGIESEAFEECLNLRSVTIGNNVTVIGREAFHKSGIRSVVIGDGVKTIGMDAFSSCKALKKVTMGKNVETIDYLAFSYSPNFEEITIPSSCKYIRLEAFKDCVNLKRIYFEDGSDILKCETTYWQGENVFDGCKIEYVYQGRTFQREENNVKCYMFGHSTIKEVCIGPNVKKVDDFINCKSIKIVRALLENPQIIASFSSTTYASAQLIVPIGTKHLYEESDDWRKFFNIVEEDMSAIKNNQMDNKIAIKRSNNTIYIQGVAIGKKIEIFNSAGVKLFSSKTDTSNIMIPVSSSRNNIYIVRIGNQVYKIR